MITMGYFRLKRLGIGLRFPSAARWGWDRYCHTNIWSGYITHDLLDVKNNLDKWVEFAKEVPAGDLKRILRTLRKDGHISQALKEPPAFAKRSILTVGLSGELEQWVQCDICFKWRRLLADYLLPPQWRCQENGLDLCRCSCAALDELAPQELGFLLKIDEERKKRRNEMNQKSVNREISSDMADAQVNGAGARDDEQEPGSSSVAKTTKHPRHHPGCSCIVCIQPLSGKGKHKPSCFCNVCMTVKHRVKTLVMRKKKCQLEREAEFAQRNQYMWGAAKEDKAEVKDSIIPGQVKLHLGLSDKEISWNVLQPSGHQFCRISETGKAPLDLSSHPDGDAVADSSAHVSMLCLLQQA